jgi:SAM-dependent methyltransferase
MAGREAGREVRGREPGSVRARRAGTSAPAVETPAAALARLYDLDTGDQDADLDLYLALAGRTEGPILELMAGSGRVAVPLAAAGRRVVAVDLDAAMLDRARAAARADGREAARRLETVHADVDGYRHARAGRFGLALIALGSLLLLPDRPAQRRAVATLADHLAPGGVAVIDVPLLDAGDLAACDGRLTLDWARPTPDGTLVTKMSSARHDPATRTVTLVTIFEECVPGGPVTRHIRTDGLTLVDGVDLVEMAEAAGLAVETLAGGEGLEPIGPGAGRAIVVATRPLEGDIRPGGDAAGAW